MIEIIQQGTKNRVKCTFCGALLSYQKEDIKEKECYTNQRESYFLKYIICPQCGQMITMEDK